uniref:DNA-binding response regulator n=1 Tax=Thermosporothrix sp. COM3 TaxID=2490863 RepID=A0A455SKD0_9CHLR|nr:DNA-binding response regulator [Thermosporothrix sp. COM3]
MKISVLIAEPRDIFRKGQRAMLSMEKNVVHIYEAATKAELQAQLRTNKIDIVIINQLLIGDITALPPGRFIVLAPELDMVLFQAARKQGARGYLLENTLPDLLRVVLQQEEGTFLIEPALTGEIIDRLTQDARFDVQEKILTPREREIVKLLREGIDRNTIAQMLCISSATLKTHIKNIIRKREESTKASHL